MSTSSSLSATVPASSEAGAASVGGPSAPSDTSNQHTGATVTQEEDPADKGSSEAALEGGEDNEGDDDDGEAEEAAGQRYRALTHPGSPLIALGLSSLETVYVTQEQYEAIHKGWESKQGKHH
ncbi:hypothetical protein JCM10213_007632 [Rhodosporidiobolus nylandii]